MLAQCSCLAIHAAFLEDSMQLSKIMNYARSLERLAIAQQDRSISVDECRQEAQLGKQELEHLSQSQAGAFPWLSLEAREHAIYSDRMASRS